MSSISSWHGEEDRLGGSALFPGLASSDLILAPSSAGDLLHPPHPDGFLSLIPLHYIDFIATLMLSYWVFWCLIRIPVVNALFTYTTLTQYYRRYHQPETKLKHLGATRRNGTKIPW
jgi:hypothetical protein